MTTRGVVVDMMMGYVNAAMEKAAGDFHASPNEVLSAYLTLARNAVLVAVQHGADADVLRAGVEQILIELPPRGPVM